ncbi:RimK family protein [Teredinibacter haidensis]|uniref:RimK family protein n=1 Tax=Teredinibacter haidensis TaxID=2731755 RepID=UPI000948C52B|nr:RimK family protein [Teredinibacter haidensis]
MLQTLIIFDTSSHAASTIDGVKQIEFKRYLSEYPKLKEGKVRVVNLCNTDTYLSRGYYCSLLAEARRHKVLPSVHTINQLRQLEQNGYTNIALQLPESTLAENEETQFTLYFGWTAKVKWKKLARQLFEQYPTPLLQVSLKKSEQGIALALKRLSFSDISPEQQQLAQERLANFTASSWRTATGKKRLRWDMAILVNPEEILPPSNKQAIQLFVKAAAKVGIQANIIDTPRYGTIGQYDALFIRETTGIDHHTYRLACDAEREGLVVLDDPTSILRCCNKVFLHDAFSYSRVPSLKTFITIDDSEEEIEKVETEFGYPLVVKIPEGSFSRGVFKVNNREELKSTLKQGFTSSTLLLVQEYMYTEYDWRIGVLNDRPLYACKYHMARNHWQIYNHQSKRNQSGGFETLPTFEVPKSVLDAAVRACKVVGNGLYGVDVKQHAGEAYVIEVNDNPSIEHKVEDAYLGNELYMQIMTEFARRLESRGL